MRSGGVEYVPVALICIGTGVASLFSALFVMKHYGFHYTAGVSATLPASAAACYLLATSWGGQLLVSNDRGCARGDRGVVDGRPVE